MDKLQGIKPGDRVRVTFEGVRVDSGASAIVVVMDGKDGGEWRLTDAEIAAPTFQIERIEPPLAVGDMVWWNGGYAGDLEILAIKNDYVWLGDGRVPVSGFARLPDLERIP